MYINEPTTADTIAFFITLAAFVGILAAWLVLRTKLEKAEENVRTLQAAAAEARAAFERYERLHRAKETPEGDKKAMANGMLAGMLNRALRKTGYKEPTSLTQVVDHFRRTAEDAE